MTRILEIGRIGLFRNAYPAHTTFFDTSPFAAVADAAGGNSIRGIAALRSVLRDRVFDIVVCEPAYRRPWSIDALVRTYATRKVFSQLPSPVRAFATLLASSVRDRPIAVLDFEDSPYIEAADFGLMDACTAYFKRELPADPWRVLTKTATGRLPSVRFRSRTRFLKRLEKLRPLSLGLPQGSTAQPCAPAQPKTADVFFAGTVQGLPLRQRGVAELLKLRDEGLRIDIPQQKLERGEFYERLARARLAFSPEGLGWDCFRHYEAALHGAVPVIGYPSILRHAPMQDREHCFFYSPEPGGLSTTVRRALADHDRLATMAGDAAALVRRWHTPRALCDYVLEECGVARPE